MRQTDARAIMDSGLDGVELAVALALWSFADDSGRCWPALRSLCRRSGWRERAVQRSLRALEAAGVLTVHHVPGRVTPTYVLRLAELPACADAAGESDAPADVVEEGCTTDTPGARETPPVSVVHPPVHVVHPPVSIRHPPVSVVHPNPSWNPPENPPSNPPDKSMSAPPPAAAAAQPSLFSGQVEEPSKPRRPTPSQLADEAAADLLRRLDAMRLQRHPTGRALSAQTWVPKLRTALRRQSAQEVIDGWTWVLRSPEAAWHRGEERGGTDRTRDLALVLAHPEYAARRTWHKLEAAHEHDIEARPAESLPERVAPLTPYQLAVQERERRDAEEKAEYIRKMQELALNDDDCPF